jgi:uncharacterized protein YkwD
LKSIIAFLSTLTVFIPLVAAVSPALVPDNAAEDQAAVLRARVLGREASLPSDSPTPVFVVEVLEIRNGWVSASTILVQCTDQSERSNGCHWLETGSEVHLVVRGSAYGEFELVSARPWPRQELHDPLPPPIAVTPGEISIRATQSSTSYEQQVVEIVNQKRWDNGNLPPLKQVTELHDSSETHSTNMAQRDFFAHCDLDPPHTLPWDRMTAAGYTWWYAGENIAAGQTTPSAVMTTWMNSSGHRSNILSTTFREIGVGYVEQSSDTGNVRNDLNGDCAVDSSNNGPYEHYWTQNFGTRNGVFPVVIDREAYETTTREVDLYVYGEGWASEMRFSNDGSTWSTWQTFVPDTTWTLSAGNGTKTVYAQVRSGSTTLSPNTDQIELSSPCTGHPDYIDLSTHSVTGNETHEACLEITIGPSYQVVSPGNLTLTAPSIVLKNGFEVGSGAVFQAGGW